MAGRSSCRPELVWGGILAVGVAAEVHALAAGHHDCTLSAMTRRVCRTEHPAGRALFVAGLTVLSAWFAHHIVSLESDVDSLGGTAFLYAVCAKETNPPRVGHPSK